MPTITIPEDLYHRLANRAAALGSTVEALAAPALDQLAPESHTNEPSTLPVDLPYHEWKKRFDAHMKTIEAKADRYPPGHVVDVSREAMYEGCGE